jgi:hypothetical protein
LRKRPVGVLIVSIFAFAGTFVAILTGISIVHPGTFLDAMWNLNPAAHEQFVFLGKLAGYLLFCIAGIMAATGYGLMKGFRWAWWLAVAIFAVNGVGDTVNIFIGEPLKGIAGLLIAGIFLFVLFRPTMKAFFASPTTAMNVWRLR